MKHLLSKLVTVTAQLLKALIVPLLIVTATSAHALQDPVGCMSHKEGRRLEGPAANQGFVVYQQSCTDGEENTIILQPVSGDSAIYVKGFRFAERRSWLRSSTANHLNLFADDATTGLLLSASRDGRIRRLYLGRDPIWGQDKHGRVVSVVISSSLSSKDLAPLASQLSSEKNKTLLNSYVKKGINGIYLAAVPTSDGTFEIAKGAAAERLLMPILSSALLPRFSQIGERDASVDRLSAAVFFKLHLLQFEHSSSSVDLWNRAAERIGLTQGEIEWIEGNSDLLATIVEQQRKEMNHDNK